MAKTKRNYSARTLKVLFAKSGNQCAHPSCINPIVEEAAKHSDDEVVAQICHIYASSNRGPRGKPGLTSKQRDAEPNLILLCGYHHPVVDKQHKDYPAVLLRSWKKTHEAKFRQGTAEEAQRLRDAEKIFRFQNYSDETIEAEVKRIRHSRFFDGYDAVQPARILAARVQNGDLSSGSVGARGSALFWCARWLSTAPDQSEAEAFLHAAKALSCSDGGVIAEAVVKSRTDYEGALKLLAKSGTSAAKSAALRIEADKAPTIALVHLAHLAAASRSTELAGVVLAMLRGFARTHPTPTKTSDIMQIGLIACASFSDFKAWCSAVGNVARQLAFSTKDVEEMKGIRTIIRHACHLVPELWTTCADSEAAARLVLQE
jgi:hypothetical protein